MPDARAYVGLPLDDAEEKARRARAFVVVLGSDGDCPYAIPADLRGDRVFVYLSDGRVADAAFG